MRFKKTAGAVLALAMTTTALPGWAAEPTPPVAKVDHVSITPDPAIRRGVLPNGLRYLIMRNANPKGAVSLRLGFDVGSYEEDDSERGAAHFVEHMAFRSTRGFPNGASDRTFAPWGVAFGRDQNAMTTPFSTLYQLDLPNPDGVQLKAAFSWLRDVADGVVFTDEAVDRERGVVLAEMDTRNTPLTAAQEAVATFQAGSQRSVQRAPIGLRSTLKAATALSLKRFYDTWYRPENAVMVLVGDLPVDDMEAMVKTGFADWTARTPKPKRAPIVQVKPGRASEAFTVAGESLPTMISACRIKAGLPRRPDDVAALRQAARAQIWQTILNERLAQRVTKGDASLLAGMVMSSDMRDLSGTCLIIMPLGEAWEAALRAGQAELNRFGKDGPTDIEAEKAVEQIRAQLRGGVVGVASRGSTELAASIITSALQDKVNASPADALYAYDLAVEDLTPDDLKASFAADWTGSEPLLIMTAPQPAERAALMAAWTRGGAEAPQERYADQKTAPWRYETWGKPGKVVERTVVADPSFVRLRFANGLIFDFKQSKLEPNKVNLALQFGGGRRDIDDSQYMAAELGTKMLVTGGLGKNSFEDIRAKFPIRSSWSFSLNMRPTDFMLRNSGFVSGLDDQLTVLAAYMSDPGFRPDLDALLPTSFEVMHRTFSTQPTVALNLALTQAIDPGAPNNLPPREVLAKLSSADLARALKPALTGAPMELAIVGDLDEATAIQAVAATFGALPARTGGASTHAEPRFLRYPDRAGPALRIEHDGAADNAAASLIWPLYVATPERRREEYALMLLSRVFDTALRRRIREELGKTYSPNVAIWTPDFGDQGSLQVSIEAEPANIEALVQEARTVAEHLRQGEIDEQMLEDARAPILARARAARETNDWWTAAMAGSSRNPAILRETLELEPLMSALTVEEIRAVAAKWLAPDPFVGVALPRVAAPAGKVAATTAPQGAAR